MAGWATISSLATGGGTLVLAIATFASVRSSNRAARTAEQALAEQRRPVLVHARLDDPAQKLSFGDGHWVRAEGSEAVVDEDGVIYLALALRNVGAAREERRPFTISLLYSDQIGEQHTISRFSVVPGRRGPLAGRGHQALNLDGRGPRG